MSNTKYCDERLWLEGKEEACRAFIEHIPQEERDAWDWLLFVNEVPGALPPNRWRIYLAGRKGERWAALPMSPDLLKEIEPPFARALHRRLVAMVTEPAEPAPA